MRRRLEMADRAAVAEELQPALAKLAKSPLVDIHGALVQRDQVSSTTGEPKDGDLTGFEALVNHVHIDDVLDERFRGDRLLLQGVKYAEALASELAKVGRPVRVFLSRDPGSDEVVVRLFVRRAWQPWNEENLEHYQLEETMQWDVGPDASATSQ